MAYQEPAERGEADEKKFEMAEGETEEIPKLEMENETQILTAEIADSVMENVLRGNRVKHQNFLSLEEALINDAFPGLSQAPSADRRRRIPTARKASGTPAAAILRTTVSPRCLATATRASRTRSCLPPVPRALLFLRM